MGRESSFWLKTPDPFIAANRGAIVAKQNTRFVCSILTTVIGGMMLGVALLYTVVFAPLSRFGNTKGVILSFAVGFAGIAVSAIVIGVGVHLRRASKTHPSDKEDALQRPMPTQPARGDKGG
jgi:hypothetical protein